MRRLTGSEGQGAMREADGNEAMGSMSRAEAAGGAGKTDGTRAGRRALDELQRVEMARLERQFYRWL